MASLRFRTSTTAAGLFALATAGLVAQEPPPDEPSAPPIEEAAATHHEPSELPDWMAALPAADASRLLPEEAARERKVTLEGWTRNAFAVSDAKPLSFTLALEPGAKLELAFALHPDDDAAPPAPVRFVVEARAGHDARSDSWQLDADSAGRFVPQLLDLARFGRREVAFTIRVEPGEVDAPAEAESERPSFGATTALVAEPILLRSPDAPRWNVVLISIDTLRADHLGCYGYSRATSPNLDAIAAEGVRFEWDVSAAPWTAPSHMSLLTGLYPSGHHVNGSFDELSNNGNEGCVYRTLERATPTLAERLQAAGWRTHALTAGVCVDAWLGFDHGFDTFHVGPFKLDPSVPAEVDDFLTNHAESPFFLFLHTYEVHEPYLDLERGRKWLSPQDDAVLKKLLVRRDAGDLGGDYDALTAAGLGTSEAIQAFYDAGIETADAYVGFVADRLKELGAWDRTLLVVTSDHGQEFADHDPAQIFGEHGHTLYDELLHVPLVMHVPDGDAHGAVVDGIVQSVDVTPTILELLGLEPTPGAQGMSHAELARHGGTSPREIALSESTVSSGEEWKALRAAGHALIAAFSLPTPERTGIPGPAEWEQLYDLAANPGEHDDLAGRATDLLARLRDRMLAEFAAITRPIGDAMPGQGLTDEARERLRELGYLR